MKHYEILGILPSSSEDDIKRAFRSLAKKYHPDMQNGNRDKYEEIRRAYEFLSQEGVRKDYNEKIKRDMAKSEEEKRRKRIYPIDECTKIEIILAWSTEKPSFDTSFVNSCLNRLADGKTLSERQVNSLENIIVRFNIDIDKWLDDDVRKKGMELYFKSCFKEDE